MAEEFIKAETRNCSQLHYNSACTLRHCITPDEARKAVEIAREEIYEWLQEHSQEYVYWMDEEFGKDDLINDLKQAIKDE